MPEDKEYDEFVEEYLRYLRGHGSRPQTDELTQHQRDEVEDLFALLDAVVDADEISQPPLEEDPLAVRLGLVNEGNGTSDLGSGPAWGLDPDSDPIAVSLEELVHRFGDDLEIATDPDKTRARCDSGALPPVRAICWTVGEEVLLCTIDGDDFAELPRRLSVAFGQCPDITAIAVVSTVSGRAVVLRHADCVSAIHPIEGWGNPGVPMSPEPLALALGRYLEASLPRWDEITPLNQILVFAHADEEVPALVRDSLNETLSRPVRIPAKKTAFQELQGVSPTIIGSVVDEVRAGALAGDALIERIREVSEAASS